MHACSCDEVGCVAIAALRRSDTHEVRVTEGCHLVVGGREAEPAAVQPGAQHFFEPGLEERQLARGQPVDPDRVDVHAEHVEPEFGQACGVRCPQVPGAEHREAAGHGVSFPGQRCAVTDGRARLAPPS